MELGTFGAVLKFAMEIEQEACTFYESASNLVRDSRLADQFQDLSKRGEKRLKTLERIRRENVTEMILEPIVGLDSENFKLELEISPDLRESEVQDLARKLEKQLFEFYSEASIKIEFLIEASYSFELLAEANETALKQLS